LRRQVARARQRANARAAESDLLSMPAGRLKDARRHIQMVFQDPWASLNPQMVVKDIIGEGPREYDTHAGPGLDRWVRELLDRVGLPAAAANRYPHEFSGGQRQRIGIARALALTPSLIVCDEPVSSLDVSIQAQILNLLISLQDDFDLTYLFIAHDLSVVQYISDRVSVMYLGRIVEQARADQLYQRPRHPYTMSLLSSIPVADPDVAASGTVLEGEVPSPVNPPPGCAFNPRCPYKTAICERVRPELENDEDGHVMACHNPPNG
jgi:oligopeptide/dipeptide ABC transporter ATP-binding protein